MKRNYELKQKLINKLLKIVICVSYFALLFKNQYLLLPVCALSISKSTLTFYRHPVECWKPVGFPERLVTISTTFRCESKLIIWGKREEHTHAHTHTNTYAYMYSYKHKHRNANIHKHTYTYMHMQTHTHTYTHTCAHIHTNGGRKPVVPLSKLEWQGWLALPSRCGQKYLPCILGFACSLSFLDRLPREQNHHRPSPRSLPSMSPEVTCTLTCWVG